MPQAVMIRVTLCVLAFAALQGCATWRRQPLGVRDLLATRHEMAIRVHTDLGSMVRVQAPRILGDQVVGIVRQAPRRQDLSDVFAYSEDTVSVPISEIRAVDIHRISILRSVTGTLGVLSVMYVFLVHTVQPWPPPR
jgi:hypothetical protein